MDSEASARYAQRLFKGGNTPDAAGSRPELVPQQYHGGDALRRHRQDVGQEAWRVALETTHPTKLCLRHGWCVYPYRYATEPDYQRTLRGEDGRCHEHSCHDDSWTVLSGRRRAVGHCHAPSAARP